MIPVKDRSIESSQALVYLREGKVKKKKKKKSWRTSDQEIKCRTGTKRLRDVKNERKKKELLNSIRESNPELLRSFHL